MGIPDLRLNILTMALEFSDLRQTGDCWGANITPAAGATVQFEAKLCQNVAHGLTLIRAGNITLEKSVAAKEHCLAGAAPAKGLSACQKHRACSDPTNGQPSFEASQAFVGATVLWEQLSCLIALWERRSRERPFRLARHRACSAPTNSKISMSCSASVGAHPGAGAEPTGPGGTGCTACGPGFPRRAESCSALTRGFAHRC